MGQATILLLQTLSCSTVMLEYVPFSPQWGHSKALFRHLDCTCSSKSFLMSCVCPPSLSSSHLLGHVTRRYSQVARCVSNVPIVPVHGQPLSLLAHLTPSSFISLSPTNIHKQTHADTHLYMYNASSLTIKKWIEIEKMWFNSQNFDYSCLSLTLQVNRVKTPRITSCRVDYKLISDR